jgi:hypothetical protein
LKNSSETLIGTYDNIVGINSNFVNFTNEQEIQTATANQTVFTLTTMQYQPGSNSLSVFVDGVNQYGPGAQYAYTETSSTVVTFVNGLHVGALVKFTTSAINASSYGDASQITYTPAGTGAVATNVQAKLRQYVSVKDFGAVGDGITDDTAAVQLACNYMMDNAKSLFFPAGTYLVNGTVVIGNTVGRTFAPCYMFGEGKSSVIKTSAASSNPFLIGRTPGVDATRYAGRVLIRDMQFLGPGGPSAIGTGTGISFLGAQGITINNCWFWGWANGVRLEATDLFTITGCWIQYNNYGIYNVETSGVSFAYPAGTLNNCNIWNNNIAHCGIAGVSYWGGNNLTIISNNFVINANDILVSVTGAANSTTTECVIAYNYFEGNTSTVIVLGSAGIVRSGWIAKNLMLVGASTTAIAVYNIANGIGRFKIEDNQMSVSGGVGSFTEISFAGAERPDYNGMNGSKIQPGSTITKTPIAVGIGASQNIMTYGSFAANAAFTIVVRSEGTGIETTKIYNVSGLGGGNTIATLTASSTQDYSGGAASFTLTDTRDTPVLGTNTLSFNNTSGAAVNLYVSVFFYFNDAIVTFSY